MKNVHTPQIKYSWSIILLCAFFLCLCLTIASCDSKDIKTDSKHDSALERYIDEPREKARDVKQAVEDQTDRTKEELNKVLE